MRQGVVRIVDADGREGPVARLAAEGERDHAREIGLVGQHLQVDHQSGVRLEVLRHADGPVRDRELPRAVVLLGLANAPFGLANRFEVLVHPPLVLRAEIRVQPPDLRRDRIEQAAIHLHLAQPVGSAVAVAEQPLENRRADCAPSGWASSASARRWCSCRRNCSRRRSGRRCRRHRGRARAMPGGSPCRSPGPRSDRRWCPPPHRPPRSAWHARRSATRRSHESGLLRRRRATRAGDGPGWSPRPPARGTARAAGERATTRTRGPHHSASRPRGRHRSGCR